jgi:hypothetical protein
MLLSALKGAMPERSQCYRFPQKIWNGVFRSYDQDSRVAISRQRPWQDLP